MYRIGLVGNIPLLWDDSVAIDQRRLTTEGSLVISLSMIILNICQTHDILGTQLWELIGQKLESPNTQWNWGLHRFEISELISSFSVYNRLGNKGLSLLRLLF